MISKFNRKIIILISIGFLGLTYSQDSSNIKYGINGMLGGRYDNLRMCVATDAGVKGGPFGDIQLNLKWDNVSGKSTILSIPVMRPILFGAAFKMLQFEPEISIIFNHYRSVMLGAGLGLSLHYGPDYKSDLDNRGPDFFATGPLISGLAGVKLGSDLKEKMLFIRILYVALFSKEYSPGTVVGAALEYSWYF